LIQFDIRYLHKPKIKLTKSSFLTSKSIVIQEVYERIIIK